LQGKSVIIALNLGVNYIFSLIYVILEPLVELLKGWWGNGFSNVKSWWEKGWIGSK